MSRTSKETWRTESDDLLRVLRALEPVLIASAQSIPHIEHEGYFVSGGGTSLHRQRDLPDALARLPAPAGTIVFSYGTHIGARILDPNPDRYNFELWLRKHEGKVSVDLEFTGPDTNEAVGLFAQTKNRMDAEIHRMNAEIQRQEQSGATADPLQVPTVPVGNSGASLVAPNPSEPTVVPPSSVGQRTSLWHRIINHQLASGIIITVVGGLILAGIIALITILL